MKPLLKYPGGKRRELSYLLPYIPDEFDRYIEPFFGGGALYFHLAPSKGILTDTYVPLINFYKTVRDQFSTLKAQLTDVQAVWNTNRAEYEKAKQEKKSAKIRITNCNEELYYYMRNILNGKVESGELLPAVAYYFVNKTAYSGQVRHNKSGEFNTAFGHYKTLPISDVTEEHSKLLQTAQVLEAVDYHMAVEVAIPSDFMFLDPPYDSAFSSYGPGQVFDENSQKELARIYKSLPCKALLVINKTDLTTELYQDYIVEEYGFTYSHNIKNRYNRDSVHLIVCNYDKIKVR